jgi:hypothetical protein
MVLAKLSLVWITKALAKLKSMHLVLNMLLFTRTLVTYARTVLNLAAASAFKVCARKQSLLTLRITRITKKVLQPRSATASLLIK